MGILPEVIVQIRKKFADHLALTGRASFVLEPQDSQRLRELTRELASKRQLGELAPSEAEGLKEIDALLEDIARFNGRASGSRPEIDPFRVENVYNPEKGELKPPEEPGSGMPAPKISGAEADEIITRLNEQFVDKVLKKLKARADVSAAAPWEVGDFSIPAVLPRGENLTSYLSRMRAELPDRPFADADSHKDLSTLKQSHGARQEN